MQVSRAAVAAKVRGKLSLASGQTVVDELHDGDGDGAEQEDVYEAAAAEDEFADRPRREEPGR